MAIIIDIPDIGPTEFPDEQSAENYFKGNSTPKKRSALDNLLGLITGVGKSMPLTSVAESIARPAVKAISGQSTIADRNVENAPTAATIGEVVGTIPQFFAGGAALQGSKIPFLASKGVLPAMLRGALTNTLVQQGQNPTLDAKKIAFDAAAGAGGELAGAGVGKTSEGAKWLSKKLWQTVLKRPAGDIADELLSGIKPVEDILVEKGSMPLTLKRLVGMAKKEGESVIPDRNAIIERINNNPNPETITKYLNKEIESLRPDWTWQHRQLEPLGNVLGGSRPIAPNTGNTVGKYVEELENTKKWIEKFGTAKDIEKLKEIQQKIASSLYGEGGLSPIDRVSKQISQKIGRGAREALEEAAGSEGPKLAELNKIYGDNKAIALAAARAASQRGKGVGMIPATLLASSLGAAGLGEMDNKYGQYASGASLPLLLMAGMSSPIARMLTAGMLSKAVSKSPYFMDIGRSLGPILSGTRD